MNQTESPGSRSGEEPVVEARPAPVPSPGIDAVAPRLESRTASSANASPEPPATKPPAKKRSTARAAKPQPASKDEPPRRDATRKASPQARAEPADKPISKAKGSAAVAPAPKAAPEPRASGKPAKKPAKAEKSRPQLVRDSFTMPESDFGLIASLKAKALGARRPAKKSELLRAGLHLLSGLEAKALVAALGQLEPVKIGRPKRGH